MQLPATEKQACTKHTAQCTDWMDEAGGLRPPCCTAHLTEILFCADELLTEYGIVHWIDFGTLLGATRHQAMIPWDYDVDISFMDGEPSLLAFLAQIFHDAGYCAQYNPALPDELKINYSETNHNHLDLYAYRRSGDGILRMRWAHNSENWFFPEHFLEKMEPVTLYGRSFLAPSPLHDFLSRYRYGPHYQIPMRFSGGYSFFFEPKDYTPVVATLFQEFEQLVAKKRTLQAQVTSSPPLNPAQPTSRLPPWPKWPPWLQRFALADDRLVYLIYESYKLSPVRRSMTLGLFWKFLHKTNLLVGRVQRNYHTSLTNEEITPAVYWLLYGIAKEKEQVQILQKMGGVPH